MAGLQTNLFGPMKITDIVLTEMTIVLGIYGTKTFIYFKDKVYSYGKFFKWCDLDDDVIQVVEFACNRADKIIFVLDGVQFPINTKKSYTCGELELICKNEQFFNKTVFVKGNNVIDFDKNLVLN